MLSYLSESIVGNKVFFLILFSNYFCNTVKYGFITRFQISYCIIHLLHRTNRVVVHTGLDSEPIGFIGFFRHRSKHVIKSRHRINTISQIWNARNVLEQNKQITRDPHAVVAIRSWNPNSSSTRYRRHCKMVRSTIEENKNRAILKLTKLLAVLIISIKMIKPYDLINSKANLSLILTCIKKQQKNVKLNW